MKLGTYVANGAERFGLVLNHPHSGEAWVFEPGLTQRRLLEYARRGTSPFAATRPIFWEDAAPTTLIGFLEAGAEAMTRMRRMEDFLLRFLEGADTFMLVGAGHRLAEVKLRAPIPRPRLIFGLVQNSPTVWRHVPERRHLNVFPQGHQRPQGTVIDPGDPIVLPYARAISGGWNPELGVIIGTGGRDIPVGQAMHHVAGLTIVSDVTVDYFRQDLFAQPEPHDWFEDAMTSWGDKKSDSRFPVGPYLVTLDEVGNPYDLLIYTRQSGMLRDRSHTGAMNIGIERTISWLSSFRTLHPGDILHMGTMGYDGSPFPVEPLAGDVIESEIERLGVLTNPVAYALEADDAPGAAIGSDRLPPAVRELVGTPAGIIRDPGAWSVDSARHFWTLFGNNSAAETREGLARRPYPRFLGAPNTALAASGHRLILPKRARSLSFGCELACVVGRIASRLTPDQALEAILGFAPMAVIRDSSFKDEVVEPASMQERHLPAVYARWADGFNIIGAPQRLAADGWKDRRCLIRLDGWGEVETNTRDYLFDAAQILVYMTRYITLFPGDAIALGSLGREIVIPADSRLESGISGYAEIDGLGRAAFTLA
ncbi:MAG: fumarylacetoacetate hydrolase family protein [Anaerolineae bacterium]|nr:fumarylacetoacetate hydrolase family protein [Anaerolineae bacterium]NUQ03081.1 fumarylacetoacetate hydrolase family protein [Anaerolineae bacterium]